MAVDLTQLQIQDSHLHLGMLKYNFSKKFGK